MFRNLDNGGRSGSIIHATLAAHHTWRERLKRCQPREGRKRAEKKGQAVNERASPCAARAKPSLRPRGKRWFWRQLRLGRQTKNAKGHLSRSAGTFLSKMNHTIEVTKLISVCCSLKWIASICMRVLSWPPVWLILSATPLRMCSKHSFLTPTLERKWPSRWMLKMNHREPCFHEDRKGNKNKNKTKTPTRTNFRTSTTTGHHACLLHSECVTYIQALHRPESHYTNLPTLRFMIRAF